ncbi:FkbM family methyltransferase [Rathayibacter sp. YIM 133350]
MGRFISFAQNGEDVVLNRALSSIERGVYIDVGANDPTEFSITRAFYDRGWRGIAVEPNPILADRFRAERPRDLVVQAAATDSEMEVVTLHAIGDTGLSTLVDEIGARHASNGWSIDELTVSARRLDDIIVEAGLAETPIHFMTIDTEGAEGSVLRSIDLSKYRPWVLVIEATAPLTTEPTHREWEHLVMDRGYRYCMFDGLSRFYVAEEQFESIGAALSYPAGMFDSFVTVGRLGEEERIAGLERSKHDLERKVEALASRAARTERAEAELQRLRSTWSWRLTRPLRAVRSIRIGPQ